MAEMFMEKMHVFGNLLQDEWQVFTTPETHLPKIPLERITLFLFFGVAFRVDKIYDQTILLINRSKKNVNKTSLHL